MIGIHKAIRLNVRPNGEIHDQEEGESFIEALDAKLNVWLFRCTHFLTRLSGAENCAVSSLGGSPLLNDKPSRVANFLYSV